MDEFIYKAPYEEEGKRILEVNILPETYCSFNCIYCPIDRKEDRHQTDEIQDLGDVTKALDDLGRRMEEDRIEEVFLNGHGESLLHQALPRIIDFIHQKGAAVRLLSNGYLLHRPEYQAVANRCEAVIGELKNAADAGFQKSHAFFIVIIAFYDGHFKDEAAVILRPEGFHIGSILLQGITG